MSKESEFFETYESASEKWKSVFQKTMFPPDNPAELELEKWYD